MTALEGTSMRTTTVELHDASARLPELIKLVQSGTDVILTESGTPRARLVNIPSPARTYPRIPGLQAGQMWMSDDFDAELPDSFWLGEDA
jgi:prevent-host-death family protein